MAKQILIDVELSLTGTKDQILNAIELAKTQIIRFDPEDEYYGHSGFDHEAPSSHRCKSSELQISYNI